MSLVDIIAGQPTVYGLLQDLAGRKAIARRLQPWLDQISGRVLDVGGGTGRISAQLRPGVRYLCVDNDRQKLLGLRRAAPNASGLLADATALPFEASTADAVLLIGVTHHLSEEDLRRAVSEIARVLVPSGRLIVLDALWAPRRFASRALWACDRGSHPRDGAALETAMRAAFDVEDATTFAVLHEYYGFNCRKPLET